MMYVTLTRSTARLRAAWKWLVLCDLARDVGVLRR